MGGTVPIVRTDVAIVLGLMCVFLQMVAVRVNVGMVSLETHVLMVSLSFTNSTFFILSKCLFVINGMELLCHYLKIFQSY